MRRSLRLMFVVVLLWTAIALLPPMRHDLAADAVHDVFQAASARASFPDEPARYFLRAPAAWTTAVTSRR